MNVPWVHLIILLILHLIKFEVLGFICERDTQFSPSRLIT